MQFKTQLRKRYEQGLTLIEASMVLALSAVVVAGVMLYYQSAQANNKFMAAQSELASLQTIVESIYGGRMDYSGLVVDIAKGSSAIPPNLQDPVTHLPVTPWSNGQIMIGTCTTVTHCNGNGHPENGAQFYYIAYANVPESQCVPILSQQVGGLKAVAVAPVIGVGWAWGGGPDCSNERAGQREIFDGYVLSSGKHEWNSGGAMDFREASIISRETSVSRRRLDLRMA